MDGVEASEKLQALQNEILEAVARGEDLRTVAELLCIRAETLAPNAICSVLTIDEGRLHTLAAPSLPDDYSSAIDGAPIGPRVGSCGTAAYLGKPVEVSDIDQDPLWADYKHLALPLGLLACWSSPIKARDGRVVGTFAFYYRTHRGPGELERRIVETCVYLCAIAIEHDEAQSRIHQLAYFDALTGLPNRTQFQAHAAKLVETADRALSLNVLYVDLDDFKTVNDTLGHHVGDALLGHVARRLAVCLTKGAFLARLGGDEFAIVQPAANGRGGACALAERIIGMLDNPFDIEQQKVAIGASVGIAHAPAGEVDLAELSRRADVALYAAKREGRGTYRFFAPEMDALAQYRLGLRRDLRAAIAERALTVAYQPIVSLDDRRVAAFEALVRWNHPLRGEIAPADFIPIAEEIGLIASLGDFVLRAACAEAARWPSDVKLAVNLSALQLEHSTFVLDVVGALTQAGLRADRLELEITESALLAESAATRTALAELHKLGVGLSLDDFGTGYSSLRSLRSFPVDKIKIDRSFVADIGRNGDSDAIIRAVVGLARDLGVRTVAEGIEHRQQAEWLAELGCTEGQGRYFSEALVAAEAAALVDVRASAPPSRTLVAQLGDAHP